MKLMISRLCCICALAILCIVNISQANARSLGSGTSKQCPIYNKPICDENSTLVTVQDSNDCIKPVCKKNTIETSTCPTHQIPVCGNNMILTKVNDPARDGCFVPTCIKKEVRDVMPNCPQYMPAQCGKGEVLKTFPHPSLKGCIQPRCVREVIDVMPNCPQYMPARCGKGQSLSMITMSNGCQRPTCIDNRSSLGGGASR